MIQEDASNADRAEPELRWPLNAPSTGAVRLRAFRSEDAEMVQDLATDPYLPTIGTLAPNADRTAALEWIRRQLGRPAEGRGFSFCIADARTDAALGTVGLWLRPSMAVARNSGRASIGYGVAPRARGRRAAADGVTAVVDFAWTLPWLHRLEAYVQPWNTASVRTVTAAGFRREGLLRSHQPIGGRRVDMLLFARLRDPG